MGDQTNHASPIRESLLSQRIDELEAVVRPLEFSFPPIDVGNDDTQLTTATTNNEWIDDERDLLDSKLMVDSVVDYEDEEQVLADAMMDVADAKMDAADTDDEDWSIYDENEGQELEELLDQDMKTMELNVEEFKSIYEPAVEVEEFTDAQSGEFEVYTNETELKGISRELYELTENAVRSSTSKALISSNVRVHPSIPSLAMGIAGYRQDGLFDIRCGLSSFCSSSSGSEMTWPRSRVSDVEGSNLDNSDHSEALQATTERHSEVNSLDTDLPVVLEADNAMMEKFQAILKNHLLMQLNRIKDQIQNTDSEKKRFVEEGKQQAEYVFREDHFVKQQRTDIESYKTNLEQTQTRRETFEKELENMQNTHKQMKQVYNQAIRYDEVLIKEREIQNELLQKMRAYEEEKLQNLILSEVASKNLQTEKKKLAEEKMNQDMILWKLEKEIIRLNNEIVLSTSNCEEMLEETLCLNKLLQKIEENSLATEAESKILQSTIIKIYMMLKDLDGKKYVGEQNLGALIFNYNLAAKNKIYWVNKLKKECFELENLESHKGDLLLLLDQQRNKLIYLEQLIQRMEREVEKKHLSLTLAEGDFKKLEKEEIFLLKLKHNLEMEVSSKVTKMERLRKTLDDVLNEEQVSRKGLGYLQIEIKKLGDLNRQTEERIVDSELHIAKLLLEVEKARTTLLQFTSDLENTHKASKELELETKEATTLQKRLKSNVSMLISKQQVLERRLAAKKKADPENVDAEDASSWAETKLKRLQEVLRSMADLTKKLSEGWFNLQNLIMRRKDDRARQIHQINIKRKHCLTVDACRLRIERSFSNVTVTINQFKKEISKEQRYFERWQNEKFKSYEKMERLKSTNTELETKFIDDVSEAEKEGKLIEEEISKTKVDIEEMNAEVSHLQAELLEVEKKKELAGVAKEKIEQFQAPSGEIGQLKQEIHRMEVRHSHLKKAQDRLMLDLEQCISRRDRVMDNAEAREVRSQTTGKNWSRVQIQRKIDDVKNKSQSFKRKNAVMHKEQLERSYQLADVREEYDCMRGRIEDLRSSLEQLEGQMEEGLLHKHACLETTAYRQRKAKLLEDFKFSRYRHLYKTPGTLAAEEEKQQCLMSALQSILDNLLNDFPRLNLQIAQIMNTLQPVLPTTWDKQNVWCSQKQCNNDEDNSNKWEVNVEGEKLDWLD